MIRLFIALKIPLEIRNEIVNLRNKAIVNHNDYMWEPEEKIHLTLKFIGDVKKELTEPILSALKFVEEYGSFSCSLKSFDFFYKDGEPKILWMGLDINNEIINLVTKINNELEKFFIAADKRKFKAHLTIKRLKGNEGIKFENSFKEFKVPEIKFKASEIALVKSELFPYGSKYSEIEIYKLK